MNRTLRQSITWVEHGTSTCSSFVATLHERSWRAPTNLEGWTVRHLVAHLAANADALGNLVHWAATGEETPMYSSTHQRADDIEQGARLSGAELREWFDRAASQLDTGMEGLTDENWQRQIRTAQGRIVPASEIPWLRAREVMVHGVDLGATTFAELPIEFLVALGDDIVGKRSGIEGHPALSLDARDAGISWAIGNSPSVRVTGSLGDVVGYLAGRPASVESRGGAVPSLPAWL